MRPDREHGARCVSKDFFRRRSEEEFAEAGAAVRSDHQQVDIKLTDGRLQILPDATLLDQNGGLDSGNGVAQRFSSLDFFQLGGLFECGPPEQSANTVC